MQVVPPEPPVEEPFERERGIGDNQPPREFSTGRGEVYHGREAGHYGPHGMSSPGPGTYPIYARFARGCWFNPPPDGRDLKKIMQLEQTHEALIHQAQSIHMRDLAPEAWPTNQPINPNSYMAGIANANRALGDALDRAFDRGRGANRARLPGEDMGREYYVAPHGEQLRRNQGRQDPTFDAHHSPRAEVMRDNSRVANWTYNGAPAVLIEGSGTREQRGAHQLVHDRDYPASKGRADPYSAGEHDIENLQSIAGLPDAAARQIREMNENNHNVRPPANPNTRQTYTIVNGQLLPKRPVDPRHDKTKSKP